MYPIMNELITSKSRRKILALFLLNADAEFYFREISRRVNERTNVVTRELRKLEDAGLLKSERKGNLRYYHVNKDFPIYHELKSIFIKTEGFASLLSNKLKDMEGIEAAFIYGSFAKGEEKGHSDIDLFIIGDIKPGILNKKVNIIEKKKNNAFIKRVLKQKKMMIIGNKNELK